MYAGGTRTVALKYASQTAHKMNMTTTKTQYLEDKNNNKDYYQSILIGNVELLMTLAPRNSFALMCLELEFSRR